MRTFRCLLVVLAACGGAPASAPVSNTAPARPRLEPQRELTATELASVSVTATDDAIKHRLAGRWLGRMYDPESNRVLVDTEIDLELRADGRFTKSHRRPAGPCETAGNWQLERQTPDSVEIVLRFTRHCRPELSTYSYVLTIRRLDADVLVLDIGPTGGIEGYRRDR